MKFFKLYMYISLCICAKSLRPCPILCNPIDCSPSGSSVHGILGKNAGTGWGCHTLLQDIILIWGLNLCLWPLLHFQVGSLPLVPPGKPHIFQPVLTVGEKIERIIEIVSIYKEACVSKRNNFPNCFLWSATAFGFGRLFWKLQKDFDLIEIATVFLSTSRNETNGLSTLTRYWHITYWLFLKFTL